MVKHVGNRGCCARAPATSRNAHLLTGRRIGRMVATAIVTVLLIASCGPMAPAPTSTPPTPSDGSPTATEVRFLPSAAAQSTVSPRESEVLTPPAHATATRVAAQTDRSTALAPAASAPSERMEAPEERPPADPPSVAREGIAEPAAPSITHTVQPGDTLLGVALAHNVPMAAIQLGSDMGASTVVRVGQVLRVPRDAMWVEASPFWVLHEVAAGETLGELAKGYGLTIGDLLAPNGLENADLISVGQLLILPLNGPAQLVATAPDPTAKPVPQAVPTATAQPEPTVAVDAASEVDPQPAPTVAATVVPTAIPAVEATVVAPPADTAALASEIFRLLNEQRAAYGLPPLAWNATLAYAAQAHADDCQARGWCGHTGSDGSTYRQRIMRAGYDPARWSECWAWYRTPELAVAMWMDEVPPNDPHRRTILSDYLTEVGVGVVPGNGHGYYYIADFGTPRVP